MLTAHKLSRILSSQTLKLLV